MPVYGLKIFISYARRDGATFADELAAGLELAGFDAFFDRADIAIGEAWEKRLETLISSADTVLFVVTPGAVSSAHCRWEVEMAVARGKRLIPVIAEPVDPERLPAALAKINFVDFSGKMSFARALKQLAGALNTDVEWLREHTRLAEAARRWVANGRRASQLLRGPELAGAEAWLAGRPNNQSPTAEHLAFIAESAEQQARDFDAERHRLSQIAVEQVAKEEALAKLSRRTAIGLGAAGTLTLAAAGFAYWGVNAEQRFLSERRRADEAALNSNETAIQREIARTDLRGQLVAYAAAPGSMALDGEGGSSPFTTAVLSRLAQPNNDLLWSVMDAQGDILSATAGQQRPFVSTDLNGEIYLRRPSKTRRVRALCVSCDYNGRFQNVANDAQQWRDAFDSAGYPVTLLNNPTVSELRGAVNAVARDTPTASEGGYVAPAEIIVAPSEPDKDRLVVFFYAGPGLRMGETERLLLGNTMDASNTISVSWVQTVLRMNAAASALVLDTGFPDVEPPTPA